MGCASCGTGNGKPSGCRNNGGCSSGGCNRLNVHDWLSNLPFHDPESSCRIVEVTFNHGSRKEFYRNGILRDLMKGDLVAVEGVNGYDIGTVNLTGELVRLQMKKRKVREDSPDMRRILRMANGNDIQKWQESKSREQEALTRSRAVARQMKLNMKICEVDLQADGRKATFYYIADERVDFRELIKVFANEFRVKVEMRQIGARQESAKVGGIGSCGRELCCSSWLTEFKSVTTTIARYQNLSINQTKLSGQCGRLKCCLNFELDTYLDALQQFPQHAEVLETVTGRATLVKKDIFKGIMWYVLPDSGQHYPLTTETVAAFKEMNARGERAPALVPAETNAGQREREAATQFVDVVGQISLRSLERNSQKRRMREKGRPATGGGKGGSAQAQQTQQRSARQHGRPEGRRDGGRPPQRDEKPKGGRPSRQKPPGSGSTPPEAAP